MELVATCAFGLEKLVYQEIKKLGLWVIKTEDGRVIFEGSPEDLIRANLWLRTAERIQIKLAGFEARTFDELFDQTYALDWASILPENATFPVLCSTSNSTLHNEPSIQSIVKKAIVKKLQTVRPQNPLPETGPVYSITARLQQDYCTLSLDSTGDSLHKRGYRSRANLAPIKETLAAALVLLSDWEPGRRLVDPFCGSGTILVEAAMIGLNIAPGLQRNFAFENWPNYPAEISQKIRQEAASQHINRDLQIYGSDLDPHSIEIAQHNVENVGLSRQIYLQVADFRDLPLEKIANSTVIANPPYGERFDDLSEVEKIYADLGKMLNRSTDASFYVFTSFPNFEKVFRRKAVKNRKLFNGKIPCRYYQYPSPQSNLSKSPQQ